MITIRLRVLIVTLVVILLGAGGGALAGEGGVLGGLAAGAVASGIGFLAPEFMEWLHESRKRSREQVAAREREATEKATVLEAEKAAFLETTAALPSLPAPGHLTKPEPSLLLRPDQSAISFTGRLRELESVRGWCFDSAPRLLLVTGGAGTGKTRLVYQAGQELEKAEWLCRIVPPGREAKALDSLPASHDKVLLIVDYAETRPGLQDMLIRLSGKAFDRVKVVLISRARGEWWDQLEGGPARGVTASARHLPLTTDVGAGMTDEQLVRDAVPQFAARLGVAPPQRLTVVTTADGQPLLVLHCAALVAALRSMGPPDADGIHVIADYGVLEELMRHERDFWAGSAQAAGVALNLLLLRRCVAVASLLAPIDRDAMPGLLRMVPGLSADAYELQREQAGAWLSQLYATAGTGVGGLQPDLVAEYHVTRELSGSKRFSRACLGALDDVMAMSALTVLTRAAQHQADAVGIMRDWLDADFPRLAKPAITVAIATGGQLGQILAEAAGRPDVSQTDLKAFAAKIPALTDILAAAHLAAVERIVAALPDDSDTAERASRLLQIGRLYTRTGHPDRALPVLLQAVALYRHLASTYPDRYQATLASALAALAPPYQRSGQPGEALPVLEEAIKIRRALVRSAPGRYKDQLAETLANYSVCLGDTGRSSEALPILQEAVAIRRELSAADRGRYQGRLAATLHNLGVRLADLGYPAQALEASTEAVTIYRELAAAEPDRYQSELALALNGLALKLAKRGRLSEALPPATEAVRIRRNLALSYPDRYRPDLAASLGVLAQLLGDVGDPVAAVPVAQEAVGIYRALAPAYPDRYRTRLADRLVDLAKQVALAGDPTAALNPAEEAVAIYRDLAVTTPGRYSASLATALSSLGARLSNLGRWADALSSTSEALTIYRHLSVPEPKGYREKLATALNNQAIQLAALDRPGDALRPVTEAIRIRRDLARSHPDRCRPDLAASLANYATWLADLGDLSQAVPVMQEAAGIYRDLAATQPDRYRARLASVLKSLGTQLSQAGHEEEAQTVFREAVNMSVIT